MAAFFRIFLIAILSFSLLQGCKLRKKTICRMNITDARALYIAPSGAKPSVLHKLVDGPDGPYTEAVRFYDADNTLLAADLDPVEQWRVNDEFTIIHTDDENRFPRDLFYLVRSSDGAVFLLRLNLPTDALANHFYYYLRPDFDGVQTDGLGNMYFRTSVGSPSPYGEFILKIDITDPDNITCALIVSDGAANETRRDFSVGSDGTVVYNYYFEIEPSWPPLTKWGIRIRSPDGSLHEAPSPYAAFWKGLNGRLHFAPLRLDSSATIDELSIDPVTNECIFSPDGTEINIPGTDSLDFYNTGRPVLASPAGHLLALMDDTANKRIVEVENPESRLKAIDLADTFSRIDFAGISNGYLYISGLNLDASSVLLKADLNDYVFQQLFPPGEFELKEMTVFADDVVCFTAVRTADSVSVLGQIDASGALSILAEGLPDMPAHLISVH